MATLPKIAPDKLVPGGILPSDVQMILTNDGTCSRCRKVIDQEEVPLRLWLRGGRDLYQFCECCCGVSALSRAFRRWGMGDHV